MDTVAELGIKLPSGFRETRASRESVNIGRQEIPWLEKPSERVGLVRVTLQSGTEFYLGSLIREKSLVDAAEKLDKKRKRGSEIANKLFYAQIQTFVEDGYNPDVHKVEHPRVRQNIYYVKNPDGERVYFMRFPNIDGKYVIIRLSACHKSDQRQVLKTITYD